MAFSPDGKTLICGYESTKGNRLTEGTVYLSIVDVQSGRKQIKRSPVGSDNAIALGPSSTPGKGDVLAIQTRREVSLLDSKTLHSMARLRLTSGQQSAASIDFYRLGLDFSDNGKTLAVPLSSSKIQIWRIPAEKPGLTLNLPNLYNSARALSPDGDTLAFASDREIALWNTRSGKKSRATDVASLNPITALDFSPDGKLLAVATWKRVTIYDSRSLKLLKQEIIPDPDGTAIVGAVTFTPDSKSVQFMTIHMPTLYRWHFK
jgi:WD40 repeat protein